VLKNPDLTQNPGRQGQKHVIACIGFGCDERALLAAQSSSDLLAIAE